MNLRIERNPVWVCPRCGHAGEPHCPRTQDWAKPCGWETCPSKHTWDTRTGHLLGSDRRLDR